jgi:5'(3')-deoxyribonucleotidase
MAKASVAIDMDDVMALFTKKVLETLRTETGFIPDPEKIQGKFLSQSLEPRYVEIVSSYPYRKGFFRDLEVMPHSRETISWLTEYFDVTIVTACMFHPNSLNDKLAWLNRNFPFIPPQKIIFCGEKQFICTDYLIDDHPRHLVAFHGIPLMFSAYHNVYEKRFRRFYDWIQVRDLFDKLASKT